MPGGLTSKADLQPRGPGRPRKWASEAERKRAYRERLAADLAAPAQLRRDLRDAGKRIGELERAVAAADRDLARATRSLGKCANERDRQGKEVEKLRKEVRELWDRLSGGMW